MSRFGDDYDGEEFPNANALFWANADKALKGRRGRRMLADLRDALMALPEHRLIDSALCTVNPEKRAAEFTEAWMRQSWLADREDYGGAGVCAIGALLWHRKVKAGMDPAEAFDSLPTLDSSDYDLQDTAQLAVRDAGAAFSLAYALAWRNDETYEGMTPEERYTAFLAWIDAELAETAAA